MFDKNLVYENELYKIYTTSMCESLTKYCTCSMGDKPPLRDYKVYICEPKDGSSPKFVLFNEQGEPIAESTGFDSMGVEIEKLRFLKGVKHEK